MKKKKVFIILIVILILIISGVILKNSSSTNKMNSSNNNISIIKYKAGTSFKLKKININNDEDIKELSKYVEELKPLSATEMVDLAIMKEIDIQYNDYITISIQLDEESYCYYTNTEENISSLSKMPQGLYKWVKEKIK
jgi:hypothetical protein